MDQHSPYQREIYLRKMDLLGLILIRLPLEKFTAATAGMSSKQNLISRRAHIVNRVDPEEYTDYIALCTWQGELCSLSQNYLPGEYLSSRASFLGSAEWFRLFADECSLFDFEIAMRSNIPEIQKFTVRNHSIDRVNDPALIDWSTTLGSQTIRSIILNKLASTRSSNLLFLQGYLQYPDSLRFPLLEVVFLGYISAAIKDPFVYDPRIEDAIRKFRKTEPTLPVDEYVFRIGYFVGVIDNPDEMGVYIHYALDSIQPKVIKFYLNSRSTVREIVCIDSKEVAAVPFLEGIRITQDLVSRAAEMLALIEDDVHLSYRANLLILTGRSLPEGYSPNESEAELMARVAHPGLTEEFWRMTRFFDLLDYGTVLYDLPNFFRIIDPRPDTVNQHYLHELFARGQFWQIKGTTIFRAITKE